MAQFLRSFFFCSVCVMAGSPLDDSWNRDVVGSSKYFKELELDNMVKKIKQMQDGGKKHVLVVMYGDGCKFCQEIHPQQEKGAMKIAKDTDEVAFARLDVNRFGGPRIAAKKLKAMIENDKDLGVADFDKITIMGNPTVDNNNEPSVHLAIPQVWVFMRDWKEIKQVEHGQIGWGPDGAKNLRKWMRENTGYERKNKKGKKSKESDSPGDNKHAAGTDEL